MTTIKTCGIATAAFAAALAASAPALAASTDQAPPAKIQHASPASPKANDAVGQAPSVYNARDYGPRYRDRRPGYVHYYHGYYYRQPWWLRAGGRAVTGTIRAANKLGL